MQNIEKMNQNGNKIDRSKKSRLTEESLDKSLEESWDVLHGKSNLNEEELSERWKDPEWKELCTDLAECKRVITEEKYSEKLDVDEIWSQFKEKKINEQKKNRQHKLYIWAASFTGLVASICLLFVLMNPAQNKYNDQELLFSAVSQPNDITFKIKGKSTMTLKEAATRGHILQTQEGWESRHTGNSTSENKTTVDNYKSSDSTHKKELSTSGDSLQTEWLSVSVPRGKDFTFVLTDGTKVWLNAETTLEYPAQFVGPERNVRLNGEAYFDVTSDKKHPFVVETGQIKTKVLGTEFNIRNYMQETTDITLVEGKVEVATTLSAQPIALRPNDNLHLNNNGTYELKKVDVANFISWKEGIFYFDNVTLNEIIHELGRWYNVNFRIVNKKLLDYRLHFYCNRKKSLEEALMLLQNLGHFNISFENGTVLIQ